MRRALPLMLLLAALVSAGCAGTAGSVKPAGVVSTPDVLAKYRKVAFVTSAEGEAAKMTAVDRDRIAALVAQKLKAQAPKRFADEAGNPETLHVTIAFTRYDEGSPFARFMLAGLGQIHIDANITLEDRSQKTVVSKAEVTKTFAWGGIYGVATGIKDVEEGFAEAVANVILGKP